MPPNSFRVSARLPLDCRIVALDCQPRVVIGPGSGVPGDDKPGQRPQCRRSGSLMVRVVAIAFVLLAMGGLSGIAQAQIYNFHHYDTNDGLPQVQVLSVHRDEAGYLWVGSYGGLSRYNGQEFRNYTTADGLGANVVEALAVDSSGRLWAGTGAGLCRFVPGEERFECLEHEELGTAYIHDLHVEEGILWAATDAGLFGRQGEDVRHYGRSSGLPSLEVRSIERDGNGVLWVGTTDGLVRLDPESGRFAPVDLPSDAGRHVSALLSDGETLWVGTMQGLYRHAGGEVTAAAGIPPEAANAEIADIVLDGGGRLWGATNLGVLRRQEDVFQLLTRRNGLRYNISYSLFTGQEGLVWIGHDQGLTKWVPSPFVGYDGEHGLIDPFVRTINEDEQGRLWFGTPLGVQIVPFRDGEWRIEEAEIITTEDGLQDGRIHSITLSSPGEALFGTNNGVVRWRDGEIVDRYTTRDGLPSNLVSALLHDNEGRTWVGTDLGAVFLEDGAVRSIEDSMLGETHVYRFREDERGRVWAAARDGLFIIGRDREVTRLSAADGLTDRTLWDIAPDGSGGMWVGSNGDGLFHVFADGGIERFTRLDGLVDNFVWQVLRDSRGDVWAYTNRGLSRFDGQRFQHYDSNDGLLHEEGGATGGWESHTGDLWFASADGLMRYDPGFDYPDPPAPNVVIERAMLGGQNIQPGQTLPPRAGSLDFHYAALGFRSEDAVQFRYRLKGLSDEWSDPRTYRPVTFGSLGGGDYVFEVQARMPRGSWEDDAASFSFEVRPAFWETLWFWVASVVVVGMLVVTFFRFRLRRSEMRRRELEVLVRERTEELEKANQQLQDASITDPLTGLHNRRFLVNQITKDIAQSNRAYSESAADENRDVIFMMIDLDQFKEINDSYGHLAGDSVLRDYARLISEQLRESDYVVRWGGEEFLVVARRAEASQCYAIAERIIEAARSFRASLAGVEEAVTCTCSIGVSHYPFVPGRPDGLNWEQIVDIADKAVYLAKVRGRDGWVAIHGTGNADTGNGAAFIKTLKEEFDGMVGDGIIRVESSFDGKVKGEPREQ